MRQATEDRLLAAHQARRPNAPPYRFKGVACNLAQLRLLLEDACGMVGASISMDDKAIWLREDRPRRRVMFTRQIMDGVSVVSDTWAEE